MTGKVTVDKVVFRKTPGSRWCVCVYKRNNGRLEAYAHHSRCTQSTPSTIGKYTKEEWSWLVSDIPATKGDSKPRCYECGILVPADIVTIVRLHEGQ